MWEERSLGWDQHGSSKCPGMFQAKADTDYSAVMSENLREATQAVGFHGGAEYCV